jgi:hypothetical protein
MCAGAQTIALNNTKKGKLQYISLADSDKLTASIGKQFFADSCNGEVGQAFLPVICVD